jgi:hypothetical protein
MILNPIKMTFFDSLRNIRSLLKMIDCYIEDLVSLYELKLGDSSAAIINKTEFKETDKEI